MDTGVTRPAGFGTRVRDLLAAAIAGLRETVDPRFELPPIRYTGRWRLVPWVSVGLAVLLAGIAAERYAQLVPYFPVALLLAGIGALAIALLPRWPLLAWRFALVGVATSRLLFGWDGPQPAFGPEMLGFVAAAGVVAGRYRVPVGCWVWLGTVAVGVLDMGSGGVRAATAVTASGVVVAGFAVGRWRLARRRLAVAEEVSERERAKRAVAEERARIAREMHDVVAHHMSMVVVQAETAPYRLGELPGPARQEFAAIARGARAALTEMRQVLGVLRQDGQAAERTPQPDLSQVPELLAAARRAGATVELHTAGESGDLPAAVSVTAYRLVQESLSNALRHAPGAAVRVELTGCADAVTVSVANGAPTGRVPSTVDGHGGHGLAGMRERVAMLAGSLRAGPTPDGGYEVSAVLPGAGAGEGETR